MQFLIEYGTGYFSGCAQLRTVAVQFTRKVNQLFFTQKTIVL
jgi:hypothetical protein